MILTKQIKTATMLLLFVLVYISTSAQQKPVTGTVYDSDGVTPMTGVYVSILGTKLVSTTDQKGSYTITAQENSVLVFTFMGYKEQRIVVGNRGKIDVTMAESAQNLESIVVTALGIKRSEKSLGYSVAKVDSEELTKSMSGNWLNGMAGKVAGLNFNSAQAGPGSSLRVTLRGESSIDPSKSEALFIVDGVPINSGMVGSTSSKAYNSTSVDMPVDYGNGASDLNADDIESVTVLKGAAATALYGSRAANGAIVITTKGGKKDEGVGVTFSSSVSFEKSGYWPDFQNEYGAGAQNSQIQENIYSFYSISALGITRSTSNYAWGPKFEGQMFYQYGDQQEDGSYIATPWRARDWYKGFFRTGVTYDNQISIEGNNGNGSSGRIAYKDTRNVWITPNTGYNRQNVSASFSQKVNKYLQLNLKLTYNHKGSDNLPMSGYGRSTIPYALMWSSPNIDQNWYRDYKYWIENYQSSSPGRNNPFYSSADSPYLQAYEQLNTLERDRIYGTIDATTKFNKYLSLVLRMGLDINNDFATQQKPWGSHLYEKGRYREQSSKSKEINTDFLLKYDRKINENFNITGMFGGNLMEQTLSKFSIVAVGLETPGIYNFSNVINIPTTNTYRYNKKINSLYGMAQISYKDFIFVDITGRNDWSSTLEKGNNSYFYPSIGTSLLLNSMFNLNKKIDMLKFRVSWASVGNDTDAYNIMNYYTISDFGGGLLSPQTYASPDIKPEMVSSVEVGAEGKFFKNRLGFDITYYNSVSKNQILNTPIDPATGYISTMINAGKITNKGLEISLYGTPVSNRNFEWETSIVWSTNRNQVIELAPGVDTWVISSSNKAQIEARPGGTLGAIYGTGFQKAPKGAYVTLEDGTKKDISGATLYDSQTGYPLQNTSEIQYLGDTQNKWKGGWRNSFSYKSLKLNVSVDAQFGGHAYSMTNSILSYSGKLKNSLEGRYDGLIGDGYCYDAINNVYTKNKTVTQSISMYYNYYYDRNNVETNIFSTSFIKLREVSLDYSLPKKLIRKIKFIQGATLSLYGRDLAMWTKWPQFDPEIASLDGSEITVGFESAQFPMTRTFGGSIKLKF
jgi:TonB-linked SusC/RagA family outer membrane protein